MYHIQNMSLSHQGPTSTLCHTLCLTYWHLTTTISVSQSHHFWPVTVKSNNKDFNLWYQTRKGGILSHCISRPILFFWIKYVETKRTNSSITLLQQRLLHNFTHPLSILYVYVCLTYWHLPTLHFSPLHTGLQLHPCRSTGHTKSIGRKPSTLLLLCIVSVLSMLYWIYLTGH